MSRGHAYCECFEKYIHIARLRLVEIIIAEYTRILKFIITHVDSSARGRAVFSRGESADVRRLNNNNNNMIYEVTSSAGRFSHDRVEALHYENGGHAFSLH